jgi:hypothetical protein
LNGVPVVFREFECACHTQPCNEIAPKIGAH